MGQLVCWTADKVSLLDKVVGPRIKKAGVAHRFEPIKSDLPDVANTDVVFAMGTKAQEILQDNKIIPKNRTIASMRFPTCLTFKGGAQGLLSYSAATVERDYEKYVACFLDLGLCIRRVLTGSFDPSLGKYRYVNDFSDAVAYIEQRYAATKEPVTVALDTETIGKNPWDSSKRLVSIQISYRKGHADVVYFDSQEAEQYALWKTDLRYQLEYLLTNPKVKIVGANFKFDILWLWCRGRFECTNFKMDTYLIGSLLDEDRGNSLELHTKWYVPELGGYDSHLNQTYDKDRMDLVPKTDLLQYAGGDADACRQVVMEMRDELLADHRLTNFYVKILHPAARAYEAVEQTGMLVDVPYYLEIENELKAEIAALEKQALRIVGGRICAKYWDDLKLSRPALLRDFMFAPIGLNLKPLMVTEKTQQPSTSIDHLLMFGDDPKAKAFIDVLREWNVARKVLSTYVCTRDKEGKIKGGFLSHLREDNCFHPTYFLYNGDEDEGGTNTGRTSARDPAIQTLVKRGKWAKKLRKAFIAPPGYLVCGKDYSQGELRIAACLADEPTMIQAYLDGIDLHAITAANLAGWEWDDFMALKEANPTKFEDIRYLGKAGNFGLCIEEGQRVLTHVGLVPIEQVTCWHQVWDGVEWVSHGGLLFKGYKEVMKYGGISATPDHEVWTEEGERVPLWRAASEGKTLARTGDGVTPVRVGFDIAIRDHASRGEVSGHSGVLRPVQHRKDVLHRQLAFQKVERVSLSTKQEVQQRSPRGNVGCEVRRYGAALSAGYACIELSLQGAWYQSLVQVARRLYTLGFGYLSRLRLCGSGFRQDQQRRALRTQQPETGESVCQSQKQVRVYDLLNAGPRHRFTCEGVLVSNCYGMMPLGFQNYALWNYGVKLTLEEAQEARDKFFGKFDRLPNWHDQARSEARKTGCIRSPLGRVRHLPMIRSADQEARSKAERQAINAPVQATLSDMLLWAISILHRNGWTLESPVIGSIHDQALSYVPEDDWEKHVKREKEVMENLPFKDVGWEPQLTFPVDVEIGPNLGEMKKMKL